jgi:hypothetical protein
MLSGTLDQSLLRYYPADGTPPAEFIVPLKKSTVNLSPFSRLTLGDQPISLAARDQSNDIL